MCVCPFISAFRRCYVDLILFRPYCGYLSALKYLQLSHGKMYYFNINIYTHNYHIQDKMTNEPTAMAARR